MVFLALKYLAKRLKYTQNLNWIESNFLQLLHLFYLKIFRFGKKISDTVSTRYVCQPWSILWDICQCQLQTVGALLVKISFRVGPLCLKIPTKYSNSCITEFVIVLLLMALWSCGAVSFLILDLSVPVHCRIFRLENLWYLLTQACVSLVRCEHFSWYFAWSKKVFLLCTVIPATRKHQLKKFAVLNWRIPHCEKKLPTWKKQAKRICSCFRKGNTLKTKQMKNVQGTTQINFSLS